MDDTKPDSDSVYTTQSSGERAEPNLSRGASVGRYVVIDFVDAGGMGAVYQAFDPELNRSVALKILTPDREGAQDTAQIKQNRNRMLREAQALAQLSHPNVVTVFDVGAYQNSVFIAMEFVEGRTYRQWQTETEPSRAEKLRVLMAAGRGLQAAHQAGIVHRDFKPANVMVGNDGRVMVLDFGLARAADAPDASEPMAESSDSLVGMSDSSDSSVSLSLSGDSAGNLLSESLTQAGTVMGTIGYMSSEQLQGKPANEASDQFGFCLTLFESLYGAKPFQGKSISSLRMRMKRGRLQRPEGVKIPRWLDAVIVRGLSYHGDERHASMQDLLAALADDPTVKRRRRLKALGIAGIVVLSVLVSVLALWHGLTKGSRFCQGSEQKLTGVWDLTVAGQVKQAFLATGWPHAQDTFEKVQKILDERAVKWMAQRSEACQSTHVQGTQSDQLLDLRMNCLDQRLNEMDALIRQFGTQVDIGVLNKAVSACLALGRLDRCADTKALMAAVPPPENPKIRAEVNQLRKQLLEVDALTKLGKYQAGLGLIGQALAQAERSQYSPVLAETWYRQGILSFRTGNFRESEKQMRKSWLLSVAGGPDEIRASSLIWLISIVGNKLSRSEEALQIAAHAEAVITYLHDDDELLAKWNNNLGNVNYMERKYNKALGYYQRALKIRRKKLAADDSRLAHSYVNISNVLALQGQHAKALEYLNKGLMISQQALGSQHPNVASCQNNIGVIYYEMGDLDRAIEHYAIGWAIRQAVLAADHPDLGYSESNIAGALLEKGEYLQAVPRFERALAIWSKAFGPEHKYVVKTQITFAELLIYLGEFDRALALLLTARKSQERISTSLEKGFWLDMSAGLGWIYLQKGRLKEAQTEFAHILSACDGEKCQGEGRMAMGKSKFGLAQILWLQATTRKRSVGLARSAQEDFKTVETVPAQEYHSEVGKWLKTRPASF